MMLFDRRPQKKVRNRRTEELSSRAAVERQPVTTLIRSSDKTFPEVRRKGNRRPTFRNCWLDLACFDFAQLVR